MLRALLKRHYLLSAKIFLIAFQCFPAGIAIAETINPKFIAISSKDSHVDKNSFAIIADIGGTKCRFAVVKPSETGKYRSIWVVNSQSYSDLYSRVHDYMLTISNPNKTNIGKLLENKTPLQEARLPYSLDKAKIILSVPAFIDNSEILAIDLPQINASLSSTIEKISTLGVNRENIFIINDVMAAAAGMKNLPSTEYIILKGKRRQQGATATVIGCGTGYGQASIRYYNKKVLLTHSETGFESIPILTQEQRKVVEILQKSSKNQLIMKRYILSGPGIVRLFNAVALYLNKSVQVTTSEEIIAFAKNKNNAVNYEVANKTIDLFIEFLGLSIANTIVSNLSEEIYIFGGLIQGLYAAGLIDREKITKTIECSSRVTLQKFLNKASVYLVTSKYPAFFGLEELVKGIG